MSRLFGALGVFLAAFASFGASVAAQDAFVTRIEPRSYYGATITVEEGVRVFRPLPPTRQIIINPTQTPLNLSYSESVERRYASDASNGGTTNNDGDTVYNNGAQTADFSDVSAFGDDGYRRRVKGDSTSGRRLRGFGDHGVRVNGQYSGHGASHAALFASGPSRRKAGNTPPHGRTHHGFAYSRGAPHQQSFNPKALAHHMPMHNFKVQRQQPMRSAGMMSPTFRPPVHMAMPMPHRVMPAPMLHAPMSSARGPAAAPMHAGRGHAAPAGRMGMGMGRR